MPPSHTLTLPNEDATQKCAASFSRALSPGLVIYLYGELGAGKTSFVRGLLRGLGFQGKVKSPSYSLLESYPLAAFILHHFDLYRLNEAEEWQDSGFNDCFGANDICLVEWPQKAHRYLPCADIELHFEYGGPQCRHIAFNALSLTGQQCLNHYSTQAAADY